MEARRLSLVLVPLLSLVLASPAAAGRVRTEMISRDPDLDLQASTFGGHASSADGRFVIFSANDDDLPGADGTRDVYVRDRRRDRTQLVSKDSDGQPIDTSAGDNPAISDNGRFVAFISNASNLPGSTGDGQAYVHDRRTGNTRLVSKTSSGVAADDDADDPSLSASGRFVAFASDAANLPGQDVVQSVYVHDRRTGKTRLASKTSGGTPADGHSERPSLSADGSRVAFSSQADNLPGPDTWSDVYVWDFDTRRLRHVSQTSGGEELTTPSHSTAGALSANGRFVAFESTDPALPGATNSYYLIYVHDLASRKTRLVSKHSGQAADAETNEAAISRSGRYVVFESDATNVGGNDTYRDVFIHDRRTGRTRLLSRSTSGNAGNEDSFYPSISADGRFAALTSRATNFSTDNDDQSDVFVRGPLR